MEALAAVASSAIPAPTGPAPTGAAAGAAAGTAAQPRTKSKAYQTTIAAEADDLKYESKYKELKKKVKEVEEDNEAVYVKILQAQQSIQRLRLERALIYERLATLPPPPTEPASEQAAHTHSHSSHAHQPPPNSHHSSGAPSGQATPAHAPHPLSQSFTPNTLPPSNSSLPPLPQSTSNSSLPLTPGHARDRDLFQQPQYSPSVRGGGGLPPMGGGERLPPISPSPSGGRMYLGGPPS